jgi:hypothetical protein
MFSQKCTMKNKSCICENANANFRLAWKSRSLRLLTIRCFFTSIFLAVFSNSIQCPDKLIDSHVLNRTCQSSVAIRSFHGLNFGVSNSEMTSHASGFEIFDLVTFFDDTDPARNAIFNTFSVKSLSETTVSMEPDSCIVLKFEKNILGLIQNKIAFYPHEFYNSSPQAPSPFHLQHEVVGTGTFSFETAGGYFLSITNEV